MPVTLFVHKGFLLFRPYHLCSIEVPLTAAMLAIRGKSNMVPLDRLVSEVFVAAKLLWLKKHEPAIWEEAEQFLLYEDYFLKRLTGKASISHCLASRTKMHDLQAGCWAQDILDKCGIEVECLSELSPSVGGIVGQIDQTVTARLGIKGKVSAVSGGHDQACAALGSGVIEPGLAMVSTGTAEVVEVAMSVPVLSELLRRGLHGLPLSSRVFRKTLD